MMAQGIHILIITTSINRVRFVTFWYSFWSDFKIVGTLFLRQSLSTMKRLQRKEELFWTNPLNKQLVAKPFFLRSPGAILRCTVTTFLNTVHKLPVISPSYEGSGPSRGTSNFELKPSWQKKLFFDLDQKCHPNFPILYIHYYDYKQFL